MYKYGTYHTSMAVGLALFLESNDIKCLGSAGWHGGKGVCLHCIWCWRLLSLSLSAAKAPIYRWLWFGLLQLDLEVESTTETKTKIFTFKVPSKLRFCEFTWYMLKRESHSPPRSTSHRLDIPKAFPKSFPLGRTRPPPLQPPISSRTE